MRSVGEGGLNQRINLKGAREFRQLSSALNKMIADLRDRLRLRTALNVAMEVQQKLLPARPPNVPGLDIAGYSIYRDETGGVSRTFPGAAAAGAGHRAGRRRHLRNHQSPGRTVRQRPPPGLHPSVRWLVRLGYRLGHPVRPDPLPRPRPPAR